MFLSHGRLFSTFSTLYNDFYEQQFLTNINNPGSAANKHAGLRVGDQIVLVNGQTVGAISQLVNEMRKVTASKTAVEVTSSQSVTSTE